MTKPIRRSKAPDFEKYCLTTNSEESHQISLFGWAATPEVRELYPELKWLFHIPNGGFRTKSGGAKLKAMGVKPGVSDIMLPVRRGNWPGLFIELKKPKLDGKKDSVTQPEQKVWGDHFISQGYGFVVCYGWHEARKVLIQYLEYEK